jgi:flagellar basal-body rod protein FlgF
MSWPRLMGPRIDPSQGPVTRTGRELDLAVRGPGFFAVETPAGRRYTRKGRLFTDSDGQLVDGAGNPFVTDGGSLSLPVDGGAVTIEAGGEVLVNGQVLGRVSLFEIPDPEALRPEGSATYRNDGPPAREALESRLVQGAIEESNVQPVRQMVKMLTTMRSYEATARLLKRADRLNASLIQTAA